jgi:hypothetical protein
MLNRLLPPASDRFILRNRVMEPVLSATADTLKRITCRLGILLADKESSYEERRLWFAGIQYALRRAALCGGYANAVTQYLA